MEFVPPNAGRQISTKKQEESHNFVRSVLMELPLSQGTEKVESEVLQSSHTGSRVFFLGGVVTEIAEVGVYDILFALFQLIHPHALKGCSVF